MPTNIPPQHSRQYVSIASMAQSPNASKSGILTVKLIQGCDLRLPDQDETSRSVDLDDPQKHDQWRPYAILEYDNVQVSVEAHYWKCDGKGTIESWHTYQKPSKFDVCVFSELVVYLCLVNSDVSKGKEVILRGSIRLNPFLHSEAGSTDARWVQVQDGAGKVKLRVSYSEKEVPPLEHRNVWRAVHAYRVWRVQEAGSSDAFIYVDKQDTGQDYTMRTIRMADPSASSETVVHSLNQVQHPFIAPLKFAFKLPGGLLSLLASVANGGHLFNHVQKERFFDVSRAKFYAAELICVLEYLHEKNIIACLRPENVVLDSLGHINLCSPGIFGFEVEVKDANRIALGTLEYPSPELLIGQEASGALDWWTLGIFLYEMLMGKPPFYDKDVGVQRRKIAGQSLQFSEGLPLTARDILTQLLNKDAGSRLGANGASEVKAHAFFQGVSWSELQGKHKTPGPFKSNDVGTIFTVEPRARHVPVRRETDNGRVVETRKTGGSFIWLYTCWARDKRETNPVKSGDDRWDLLWEPELREFCFKNRFTGEKCTASPQGTNRVAQQSAETSAPLAAVKQDSTVSDDFDNGEMNSLPSQSQKEEVLEAALRAGYSKRTVSQILEYDLNLKFWIPEQDHKVDGEFISESISFIQLRPLELAVKYDRPDLVDLFLKKGADEDLGTALIRAVKRKNYRLVEMLVQRTRRVTCTKALALAVDYQDMTMVNILLANGVRCDFEESDRPLPPSPFFWDYDEAIWRPKAEDKAEDYIAPLVRAAVVGNADLIRLLLAHGADVNLAYHDLLHGHEDHGNGHILPPHFSCGRAVQVAMELGHSEAVQLLIDGGADVGLPPPVWKVRYHTCRLVPRAVYLEVMAGLEAAARAKKVQEAAT